MSMAMAAKLRDAEQRLAAMEALVRALAKEVDTLKEKVAELEPKRRREAQ